MKHDHPVKLVLTGGGTGGHIYPALALWRYLTSQLPTTQVAYIGTNAGLERGIVEREQIPFYAIHAAGLKRQFSFTAVRTAATTYRGFLQAKQILRKLQPDVVLGTGGYVTLPVIFAANALGIPTVIWEGNARPGLTNILCARRSSAVAIAFSGSEVWFRQASKVVFTGNPRASEVLQVSEQFRQVARKKYHLQPNQKLLIIFTGSRGAETVNQVVTQLLPDFAERSEWRVLFVTGDKHYEQIVRQAKTLPDHLTVLPFIHDMPCILPSADLVISRAGSSTIAEICALGIPSILIPSPYVTANHQEENALRLVEQGAARMIREAELTKDRLWAEIVEVMDGNCGPVMRDGAKQLATPRAVESLYQVMMEVMKSS